MARHIHIEQHATPFDYVEGCRKERQLMAESVLTWKNAVIAQDRSPYDLHTYEQNGVSVTLHLQNDIKAELSLKVSDEQELKYEYNTASHQLSLAGKQLEDGQEAYPEIVKAHRAIFDAAYNERKQSRQQQG